VLLETVLLLFSGCGTNEEASTKVSDTNHLNDRIPSSNTVESNESNRSNNYLISESNETNDLNNSQNYSISDSNESNSGIKQSVDKSLYGNWIDVNSGTQKKIDNTFNYPIKELGSNFIEVTKENGEKEILLRNGTNKGVVRGQIYSDIKKIQKLDEESQIKRVGYIPILKTAKNSKKYKVSIDDGFTKQTKKASKDGKFVFSNIHTGGEAKITIIDIEEIINDDTENDNINNEDKNNTTNKNNEKAK